MRINCVEVEFACDQEDDRLNSGQACEAAGAPLSGLEQAVDSFQEAIGLAGLRPGYDALQMSADEGYNIFHRLDLGAHDASTPVHEHGAQHVELLALQDFAQPFLLNQ